MSQEMTESASTEKLDIELKDLYACNGTYTPEEKIGAVMAYMVTGTSRKASRICGVPEGTIRWWKARSLWWDSTMAECRRKKQDELDAMTTNVIHKAVEQIEDRVQNGNTRRNKDGEEVNTPMTAQELSMVVGILFDKRQLIRGDPTSRTETVSESERLNELQNKFEQMAKEVQGYNAKVIEGETVPEDK